MQSNKYRMRRGTLLAVSMLLFCISLLSGCGKLPEGMLKQEKRALHTGTDPHDRGNREESLSELIYRTAMVGDSRWTGKYL